jgi:hypothetical protein
MAMAIILMGLAIMALLLLPGAMGGTIVGDQPPSTGDWVITQDTVVTAMTVTVKGNITIQAVLTLHSSSILIEGVPGGDRGINVTDGGRLSANDSSIVSSNGSPYYFRVYDEMDLTRVTIRNVHGGILVSTSETVTFDRVRILDFGGPGLVLEGASGTSVRDVTFQADDYLTDHSADLRSDISQPYVQWSYDHPGIIVIDGGSPTLEGVDISINGSFEVNLRYRKTNVGGGIGLDLDWAMVYVDSKDTVSIKDLVLRDSTISMWVNLRVVDMSPSSFSYDTYSGVDMVLFRNYRDASVMGIDVDTVTLYGLILNLTGVTEDNLNREDEKWGIRAVHAFVTETFSTPGPHEFDLEVKDISQVDGRILYHHMELSYSGTSSPTFDTEVIVDNVSALRGVYPLVFEIEPKFTIEKTIIAKVTVANSEFEWLGASPITIEYFGGPNPPNTRALVLHALTLIEDCTFTMNHAGTHGLVNVPARIFEPDLDNNTFIVKGCTFSQNTATLLNINGTVTNSRDRLVIDGNTFTNNTAWKDQRTMNIRSRTEVEFTNNTFSDNNCSAGVYIEDPGANPLGRLPCKLVIANNTFVGNWDNPFETSPGAIINLRWGGELIVRDNTITDSGVVFLNLTETAAASGGATLDFHHNQVHRNQNPVMYFNNNARDHRDLEVFIRNNTVWDNKGALVDFELENNLIIPYDYDAIYHLLGNDVRRAGSTVFANYGNITVSDNTFVDCVGWVLELDYLRAEAPYLKNNTFLRCGDAVLIRAKPNVPAPVLLWMDNNQIDSNGTALYLNQMQVTMRTTTITSSAGRAVAAEQAWVDAYDCTFDMDACEVVTDGYINMWYWVEAWVYWASKSGVGTTNPVVGANVTFIDQAGVESVIAYPDAMGHLEPTEVLAWHITHSTAPVQKNPYTIMVSLSSFQTSVVQNVSSSWKGASALTLLLWDPEDPFVSIDGPEHMSAHNTLELEISGFATDIGSGVHNLTVHIVGGTPEHVVPDAEGAYIHILSDVPEGIIDIRATVSDAGNNVMSVSITVEVDRTPPRLVVTHPDNDLYTNTTEIDIRGEVEVGVELFINMMEYDTDTGVFDVTLQLNEGSNYFGLTATDRAGNPATVVIWVTRDTFTPELDLFGPADGAAVNVTDIQVLGKAVDADEVTLTLHRSFTDIIDRPIYPDGEGQFDVMAELEEGTNVIVVTATDKAGNSITLRRTVTLDTTPPDLELVSPEDETLVNARQVTVVFTVSDDAELVYVNGKRVLGTGDQETVVMLGEGENPIVISAGDALWNQVTISIIVITDTLAPTLEVTEPSVDRFKTNDPVVEVRGKAQDGDLNGITVLVAGQEATVTTDGKFFYQLTLDEDGVHNVEVIARDRAGNIARVDFTVDLRTEGPLMNLVFDPADDRVDPGTSIRIQGAGTGIPLTVTIVHDGGGERNEFTFEMINATFEHYLELKDGQNTITVRSVDAYGNWNVTAPYVVDAREKQDPTTSSGSTVYLAIAIVVAVALIGVAYVLVRRRP